ncbi:TIGR01457 family HAD-type hydrolase [Microaerobacter geothermalis]|uniref:TIGR01457 family HAD-type hydrolase n=1 Tax=Microaerobacter geothermalis TaxID=674972 RepID=UPI001F36C5F5|nr:TIGR01457 family HAD-type hydrolase [Microaerobacter geothermalis]MCF6092429.1 TIGR01457 family HAD-type hydrolase [Microaerobacter geothermalis]
MKQYLQYIIDLDGTMYRGKDVIPEAPLFVHWLIEKKYDYIFLTNNSSKTPDQVADDLNRFHIPCEPRQVITSSMVTAHYISTGGKGSRVYAIGEEGLMEALRKEGFIWDEKNPDYVICGIDRNFTYEKMAIACLAIRKGAQFISTNGDAVLPTERGMLPGNGSLTAAIAKASDAQPVFIGKPEATMIKYALEQIGGIKEQALMVGDNLHTDILSGIRAGIDTLFVLTGYSKVEDIDKYGIVPNYIVNHLGEWMEKMDRG